MLSQLSIQNYAIIDEVSIRFGTGMNILTGETGAGKSILLGALGLVLGERADSKALLNTNRKCIVEAVFELSEEWNPLFDSLDLDFDTNTIIRREILESGKSRAFVNDSPVNLQQLKSLSEKLVNLHSQHETLELVQQGFQLQVVDEVAGSLPQLNEYRTLFANYRQLSKKIADLEEDIKRSDAESEFLSFQLNELQDAKLQEGEYETLEAEQTALSNVEEILLALQQTNNLLDGSEVAVLVQLNEARAQLHTIRHFSADALALLQRIETVYEELKDIARETARLQEHTQLDPERLQEVNDRLQLLHRLMKKHRCNTTAELIELRQKLEQQLSGITGSGLELERLKAEETALKQQLINRAVELHQLREGVCPRISSAVQDVLQQLGMPSASFNVDLKKTDETLLNENGLSDVRFLFSANKGFEPREIKEVASGGELSRLMLAIKSLLAGAVSLPTMIFDEIDAGISGEVALRTAQILKGLSAHHQIICITHLPQIAAVAQQHFHIYKQTNGPRTETRIRELTADEKVKEVARMIGGESPGEAAMASARDLVNR